MTNLRIFWIIWCCFWGLGWLLVGFFFFPLWLFVPFSLLAILLPIGRSRPPAYYDPVQHNVIVDPNDPDYPKWGPRQ